jgi:hypothetical protein
MYKKTADVAITMDSVENEATDATVEATKLLAQVSSYQDCRQ